MPLQGKTNGPKSALPSSSWGRRLRIKWNSHRHLIYLVPVLVGIAVVADLVLRGHIPRMALPTVNLASVGDIALPFASVSGFFKSLLPYATIAMVVVGALVIAVFMGVMAARIGIERIWSVALGLGVVVVALAAIFLYFNLPSGREERLIASAPQKAQPAPSRVTTGKSVPQTPPVHVAQATPPKAPSVEELAGGDKLTPSAPPPKPVQTAAEKAPLPAKPVEKQEPPKAPAAKPPASPAPKAVKQKERVELASTSAKNAVRTTNRVINRLARRRAPAEMPLMYDVQGGAPRSANLVVERLIRASLRRDPDGNAYVEGSPCLTPNDMRESILRYHPDLASALPDVSALPAFIHALIPKLARAQGLTGTYTLSRMQCYRPGSRQSGDQLDSTGFDRMFAAGEYAWYFPNRSDPVFAGDCTNVIKPKAPVQAPVPPLAQAPTPEPACAEIDFDVVPGGEIQVAIFTNRPMPLGCLARWEETTQSWVTVESPCTVCNWLLVAQVIPRDRAPAYTFRFAAGFVHQRLRIPREMKDQFTVLCYDLPGYGPADSWIVRPTLWSGDTYRVPAGQWPAWHGRVLAVQYR